MARQLKKLVIIDGNALIHRAYHALPPLKTKQGQLVNAVYGFASILFKVIKDLKPDYLAAAFDLAGPTFREKEYKEYKAKRLKPPQEMYDQIPKIKELLKALAIPIYEQEGFEADDLIGSLVEQLSQPIRTIIVSGDLDLLQLVGPQTEVYFLQQGIKKTLIYNQSTVQERYGLKPKQLVDFKALRGDPSDNIPGVAGIGEKKAKELIKQFGSLQGLYQQLASADLDQRTKALLFEYKKEAFFSQRLAQIRKDVPLSFSLKQAAWPSFSSPNKVIKLLRKLEFKSLIKRLTELLNQEKTKK